MGDTEQPRPSKGIRPIQAAEGKGTRKMLEGMINKNKDQRNRILVKPMLRTRQKQN